MDTNLFLAFIGVSVAVIVIPGPSILLIVSSGIEPIYALRSKRKVLSADGRRELFKVEDFAAGQYRRLHPDRELPDTLTTASALPPEAHLAMQAALQPSIDNAISKTVNVAADLPFDAFRDLYHRAWQVGLKGCTAFRPNPVTGDVLATDEMPPSGVRCCDIEREGD